MFNALVIFAKAPIAGQVKTRLCPPLTLEQAAELATCFLIDIVERACLLPDVEVYIAFTPADSEPYFREILPFPVKYIAQRGGSLGERELNIFSDLLESFESRVVLIGSDIPTLPPLHLQEAFFQLETAQCDAIFGPSSDGGYYLVGMRKVHKELFEKITWSTPTVMAETLAQARKHNLNVGLVPAWYDVDTKEDLSHLANDLKNTNARTVAPRTHAMLMRLGFSPEQ